MGMYLTAHAGEDARETDGTVNIWDSVRELKVDRIDHGCRCLEDSNLVKHLADNKILCAMCPTSNVKSGAAESYEKHPLVSMLRAGIPVTISSDDPSYMGDVVQEYAHALEDLHLTENELITIARNAFVYSISGQKYIGLFDRWVETFMREEARK